MEIHSTTILAVLRDGEVTIGGDGQVTVDKTIMKKNTIKIRKMFDDKIISGFAGSAADGLTLYEKFEEKLKEYHGRIKRSAVELAKDWRTDKVLRRLEALMIVADTENIFIISGNGDVIEPDDGIAGIGSGGAYAVSAARALVANTNLTTREVVEKSLKIASEICVFTNDQFFIETLK